MDQDTLLEIWTVQLELLSRLGVDAGIEPRGNVGSRTAAQNFAEQLFRCRTLDCVSEAIAADVNGARSFLHEAYEFHWVLYDRNQTLPQPPNAPGPLCFLASVVIQLLDRIREFDPANFE